MIDMKAIVIGATGATGKDLVELLKNDSDFDSVEIFVRREFELDDSKFHVHVIDFDKPDDWKNLVQGDVIFSCLGTTRRAAGSKSAQWKIDHDYQFEFAKIARENGVKKFILVSSIGSDKDSKFFYLHMKGQLEQDIVELDFPTFITMQPPSLIRKKPKIPLESVSIKILKAVNAVGLFKSYAPMKTEIVAKAMINLAKTCDEKFLIVSGQKIREYAQ